MYVLVTARFKILLRNHRTYLSGQFYLVSKLFFAKMNFCKFIQVLTECLLKEYLSSMSV